MSGFRKRLTRWKPLAETSKRRGSKHSLQYITCVYLQCQLQVFAADCTRGLVHLCLQRQSLVSVSFRIQTSQRRNAAPCKASVHLVWVPWSPASWLVEVRVMQPSAMMGPRGITCPVLNSALRRVLINSCVQRKVCGISEEKGPLKAISYEEWLTELRTFILDLHTEKGEFQHLLQDGDL